MEKNYYESVIEKIKHLINTEEYVEAIQLLTIELNQVYFPELYENKFHELYNEAQSFLLDEDNFVEEKLSEQQLSVLLNGSREQQFSAINRLDDLNLRNYKEVIQEYFISDNLMQLKGRLLDLCASQKINHDFDYLSKDGMISVNPSFLEPIDEMSFISEAFDYFNNHLYKNPSMIQICQIALVERVYDIYPKMFLLDNVDEIAKSIIAEVEDMFDVDAVAIANNYYH